MFQLTDEESRFLRSQNATLENGRGQHRKYLPYVFTEHGALMAATILSSPQAIEMSVYIVRAFVRMREMLATHADLSQKLEDLEARLTARLDDHDGQLAAHGETIEAVVNAIRELLTPPGKPHRQIGFRGADNANSQPTAEALTQ